MKSMRMSILVLFGSIVISAVPTTITAQEKEKQKPGSTIDAWRQALPAEAPAQPADESTDVQQASKIEIQNTLLSLERRWLESLKVGDADSLSEIIGGDFKFVSPRLTDVNNRAKYMQYALRDLKLASYELDNVTVQVYGRTAIVSGELKQKLSVKGEDWGGNYLFTGVWISRDGAWRVVVRHESPLPRSQ